MGIAAMVIGIVSAVLAFIPFCGTLAFIPAVVGLVLGIVDVVLKSKSNKPKGQGIAGVVLNAVALIIILLYWLLFAAGAAAGVEAAGDEFEKEMQKASQQWQQDLNNAQQNQQNPQNQNPPIN